MYIRRSFLTCLIVVLGGIAGAYADSSNGGIPREVVMERIDAIQRLIEARSDVAIERFVADQLAGSARNAKPADSWTTDLKEIRRLYARNGTIELQPRSSHEFTVRFGECPGEDQPLIVTLDQTAPHLIAELRVGEPTASSASPSREVEVAALTWENLKEQLNAEARDGFSGSVLVVRDGKIVLHEGYGLANREERVPNSKDTIFAIGSTPIDFTKAAILKLEDMGELSTQDAITKFLPDVPKDKRTITIDHLMTGRSGLRNFLGRPGDTDSDNMWIDRETAVSRILEEELLFEPGTDEAHSHAAFGLLAAIVEHVSGKSYIEFLSEHLFGPAGMKQTWHYEDIRAPQREVAIGYGGMEFSQPNSPANWGKTSWLVLGSGGMVSTTGDLYRWNQGIRSGKLLSRRAQQKYWSRPGAILAGGSQNGFECAYTEGSNPPENRAPGTGSLMFVCTNEIGRDATQGLVMGLAQLVNKPKFRLGVMLRPESDSVVIEEVQPDTPAQRAGLQRGDRIKAINGEPLNEETLGVVLARQLANGKPVELQIQRDGKAMTFTVSPTPS